MATAEQVPQIVSTPGPAPAHKPKGRAHGAVIYVLQKLLVLVGTLFIASLAVFFSRFLVPGDPARFLLRGRSPKPEALAEITQIGRAHV